MRSTLLQVGPVFFAAVLFIALVRNGRIARDKVGLVAPVGPWLPLILLFAAYLGLFEFVSIRSGWLAEQVRPWSYGAAETVLRIAGIVILTPFVEEVIFRGVLQSELAERVRAGPAIVIQAAVFMACHAVALIGSRTILLDAGQLFLEGAFYGWTRHRTRSLYPSMAMHALGNSLAVVERLLV